MADPPLSACLTALLQSDRNNDDSLNFSEYIFALQKMNEQLCVPLPTRLLLRTQDMFNELACSCLNYEANNTNEQRHDCTCTGSRDTVAVPSVYPPQYSTNVCNQSYTVLQELCNEATATAAPSTLAPTLQIVGAPTVAPIPTSANDGPTDAPAAAPTTSTDDTTIDATTQFRNNLTPSDGNDKIIIPIVLVAAIVVVGLAIYIQRRRFQSRRDQREANNVSGDDEEAPDVVALKPSATAKTDSEVDPTEISQLDIKTTGALPTITEVNSPQPEKDSDDPANTSFSQRKASDSNAMGQNRQRVNAPPPPLTTSAEMLMQTAELSIAVSPPPPEQCPVSLIEVMLRKDDIGDPSSTLMLPTMKSASDLNIYHDDSGSSSPWTMTPPSSDDDDAQHWTGTWKHEAGEGRSVVSS